MRNNIHFPGDGALLSENDGGCLRSRGQTASLRSLELLPGASCRICHKVRPRTTALTRSLAFEKSLNERIKNFFWYIYRTSVFNKTEKNIFLGPANLRIIVT